MKFMTRALVGMGLLGAFAGTALAQQDDKEATKKKILKSVEQRLKQEDERLLKEIEKLIDEALKGKAAPTAPRAEVPPRKARGYIGIRAGEVTAEERTKLGIKGGIKVAEVVEGGPAAAAGLKAGDVVYGIDGRMIDTPLEVPAIIQAAGAGTTLTVKYYRNGKKGTAKVVLARHPSEVPEQKPSAKADPKKKGDLRERVKKFLDKTQAEKPKKEPRKPQAKKPKDEPGANPFGLDEELLDQLEGVFEQFGVDREQLQELLEQFFPESDEGRPALPDAFKDLLKGFDLEKFFGSEPKPEPPPPAPKPRPKFKPTGRAWLGVQPEELSEALAAQLDLEAGVGLLLVDVLPGSPAEKAGLKKNDILVAIDGKKIRGEQALAEFMAGSKIGQEAEVTILRKGKKTRIKVKLAERMK